VAWLGKSWDGIDESQPERLAPDWENQRGETSGMVRDDEQNHVFTINLEIPARFELPGVSTANINYASRSSRAASLPPIVIASMFAQKKDR